MPSWSTTPTRSAWTRDVPLVVPEVNPSAARSRPRGIIASANCTTLSMIVAVAALHHEYGLTGLVCASYQAVSGAGQVGIETLHDQMQKVAGNRELGTRVGDVRRVIGDDLGPFPAPIAMNVIPWAGSRRDDGHTSEEMKVRDESRKILGLPHLAVAVTCVRVPVVTTHSVAVHATFEREVEVGRAREILRDAPGVVLDDDPESGSSRRRSTRSARTRPGSAGCGARSTTRRALDFFLCGDNLRKGAALNTAQVAELVAAELGGRARLICRAWAPDIRPDIVAFSQADPQDH